MARKKRNLQRPDRELGSFNPASSSGVAREDEVPPAVEEARNVRSRTDSPASSSSDPGPTSSSSDTATHLLLEDRRARRRAEAEGIPYESIFKRDSDSDEEPAVGHVNIRLVPRADVQQADESCLPAGSSSSRVDTPLQLPGLAPKAACLERPSTCGVIQALLGNAESFQPPLPKAKGKISSEQLMKEAKAREAREAALSEPVQGERVASPSDSAGEMQELEEDEVVGSADRSGRAELPEEQASVQTEVVFM